MSATEDRRKVAIMGTAPSSIPDAPLDDPEWEIWGTSRLWKMIPRQDVWFELHDLDEIGRGWDCTDRERRVQRDEHLEWLEGADIPVYLQDEDERVPSGLRYPLDEIADTLREQYGDTERYFTNSISYMLAYALYCNVDEVGVWGVDMALDNEYTSQRPSVEYWIGLLRGAGITVHIPASCDLLQKSHLYGYEFEEGSRFMERLEARDRELKARKDDAENKIQQAAQLRAAALTTADQLEEILVSDYDLPAGLESDLEQTVRAARQEGKQAEAQIEQMRQTVQRLAGAKEDVGYVKRSFAGAA